MSLENPRFRRDLEATAVEAERQNYVRSTTGAAGQAFVSYDSSMG